MGVTAGYLMPHPPIMVEEVGGSETQRICATVEAAHKVGKEIGELEPDTVVIISPHGPIFQDALCVYDYPLKGDLSSFGAPQVRQDFEPDEELREEILASSRREGLPVVPTSKVPIRKYGLKQELDHGVTVPMYFVRKYASGFKLLPLSFGLLPYKDLYRFGRLIHEAAKAQNKRVAVIASGDLSHHLTPDAPAGYNPKGTIFDETLMEILAEFDLKKLYSLDSGLIDAAGECGLRSIWIMAGALDSLSVKPEVLSYEGPFGVGYGIAKFIAQGDGKGRWEEILEEQKSQREVVRQSEGPYVRLARNTLEAYVRTGKTPVLPEDLPDEMLENRAGVFVSIKSHGELRGCIGTFMPTEKNIAEEILRNAISAGTGDPRFNPVRSDELEDLVYSVDVLTSPEPVDSKEQLDPKRYGVIVRRGYKSGLLLPDLEGVDTVEDQLNIALRKAGIWHKEDYSIERFEVIRHH